MNIKKSVNEIILDVLEKKISYKDIKPEALLIETLGADSIQLLEIALTISAEFDINVPADEVVELKTVKDVYQFVSEQKGIKI